MTRTRRDVLRGVGFLTAGGLIAGCSSRSDGTTSGGADGGGGASDTTTTGGGMTGTDTTTPSGAASSDGSGTTASGGTSAPTVQVRSHPEYGDVLVDGEGMTLYLFTKDSPGTSVCTGDCASAWPPLIGANPEAGEGVTADLGTIEREDGSTQVTANGWPLYYYQADSAPGDATGQGVGDVWYVLSPAGEGIGRSTTTTTRTPTSTPAGPSIEATDHPDFGAILTDGDGRALYMFTEDSAGESVCTGSCAENWPPLTGQNPQAGAGVAADLDTIERGDGTTQVTAEGWPLYYFAGDDGPGQTNGQGVGDVWYLLRPDGSVLRAATTTTSTPTPTPNPTTTTTSAGGDGSDGGDGGGVY